MKFGNWNTNSIAAAINGIFLPKPLKKPLVPAQACPKTPFPATFAALNASTGIDFSNPKLLVILVKKPIFAPFAATDKPSVALTPAFAASKMEPLFLIVVLIA